MTSNIFHYTSPEMVNVLIKLVPFIEYDIVLDCGSGNNKVWYNNIPETCIKLECELDDGCDFFNYDRDVDWCIGNPPYNMGWKWVQKTMEISRKGFAYLHNLQMWNSLTPRRLGIINDAGFNLHKLHITTDKRWYGRYYWLVWMKNCNSIITWS